MPCLTEVLLSLAYWESFSAKPPDSGSSRYLPAAFFPSTRRAFASSAASSIFISLERSSAISSALLIMAIFQLLIQSIVAHADLGSSRVNATTLSTMLRSTIAAVAHSRTANNSIRPIPKMSLMTSAA